MLAWLMDMGFAGGGGAAPAAPVTLQTLIILGACLPLVVMLLGQ